MIDASQFKTCLTMQIQYESQGGTICFSHDSTDDPSIVRFENDLQLIELFTRLGKVYNYHDFSIDAEKEDYKIVFFEFDVADRFDITYIAVRTTLVVLDTLKISSVLRSSLEEYAADLTKLYEKRLIAEERQRFFLAQRNKDICFLSEEEFNADLDRIMSRYQMVWGEDQDLQDSGYASAEASGPPSRIETPPIEAPPVQRNLEFPDKVLEDGARLQR